MSTKKVSIVGGGAVGFSLAADLEQRGFSALVYSHRDRRGHLDDVANNGGLKASGEVNGFFHPILTSDAQETVNFSKVLLLAIPSTAQPSTMGEFTKFGLGQHIIVAVPGSMVSFIPEAATNVEIIECNGPPYTCRMNGAEVKMKKKREVLFMAAGEKEVPLLIRNELSMVFSVDIKWCHNAVEVSLLNNNGVFHPLLMLLNAGRIESTGGDFPLYAEGLTRFVANIMESFDAVLLQIDGVLNFRRIPIEGRVSENAGENFTDLVEIAQKLETLRVSRAPSSMKHRYIDEDVPHSAVFWCSVAEKLGIDAAPIRYVIGLIEMGTKEEYMKTGRSLQYLGLGDLSREDFIKRFSGRTLPERDDRSAA
jgi:hypothetical protein